MKDVMNVAYKNGAKSWTFAKCITKDQTLLLNKNEYKSFLEEMVKSHKKYESQGANRLEKEPLLSVIYNQIEEDKKCNIAGCGIGGPNLTIMPNLEIIACRRHPGSNLGKWSKDNNFLKIFLFNEKMNQFRELDKIEKCNSCKFLKECKGCKLPKPILVILSARIINCCGNFVRPFLTLILIENCGMDKSEIGFFVTGVSIASILGVLVGGYITDKFGRKNIMINSSIFSAGSIRKYIVVCFY